MSIRRLLLALALPALLVLGWWLISSSNDSFYWPPLDRILASLETMASSGRLVADAIPTLYRLLVGYVGGCAIGVMLGILLGLSPRLLAICDPLLQFMRALPAVALLPLLIVMLGIGDAPKIALTFYAVIWPVFLNTITGIRAIDPAVHDMVRSYHLPPLTAFRRITLPAASPHIAVGMRVGLSVAIVVVIMSEMLGASNGIGYMTLQAQQDYDIPAMWAGMIIIGTVGSLLNRGFAIGEDRILHWHRAMRATLRTDR